MRNQTPHLKIQENKKYVYLNSVRRVIEGGVTKLKEKKKHRCEEISLEMHGRISLLFKLVQLQICQ